VRLFLIEGFAGTGKTTTAQWLADALGAVALTERSSANPLLRYDATTPDAFVESLLARWDRWLTDSPEDAAFVVDGAALQHPINWLLLQGARPPVILDALAELARVLTPTSPAFVYLFQNPAIECFQATCRSRSSEWFDRSVRPLADTPFGAAHPGPLDRQIATFVVRQRALHEAAFARWPHPLLRVDVSGAPGAADWDRARERIARFARRPRPSRAARVEVVDYDPRWPEQFEQLRARLARVLDAEVEQVEHVGSTSVPGLAAKPILDIDVVVARGGRMADTIDRLEGLGYLHIGPVGVAGREVMVPADDPEFAHHLYVCAHGSRGLSDHLRLRDRLRDDDEALARYADLKRELAQRYRTDRDAYTEAKSDFINALLSAPEAPLDSPRR